MWVMKRPWLILVAMVVGGCGTTGLSGAPDAEGDVPLDTSPDVDDVLDTPPDLVDTSYWDDVPGVADRCGDGVLDDDEECDDGNRMNDDGCDWLCRLGDGDPLDSTPDPGIDPIQAVGEPTVVETDLLLPVTARALDVKWNGEQFSVFYNHRVDEWFWSAFRLFDADGAEIESEWETRIQDEVEDCTLEHVWNGTEYGLFYAADILGGIWFVRVSSTGKVISDPILVVDDALAKDQSVVWTGSAYAMVWEPRASGGEWPCMERAVMFVQLDEYGRRIMASDVQVETIKEPFPDIGWGGDGAFRLATGYHHSTECEDWLIREQTLLQHDGSIIETTNIANGSRPVLTWRGDEYAIVFMHPYPDWGTEPISTYMARFADAGHLLEAPYQIMDTYAHGEYHLVSDPTGFVILWKDYGGLNIARLDARGRLVGDTWNILPDIPSNQWDMVAAGDTIAVFVQDRSELTLSIYLFR